MYSLSGISRRLRTSCILYDASRCHHPFSEVPRNCQSAVLLTRNFSLKVESVVVYPGVSGTLKNGGRDLLYFSMVTYMKGSKGYGFTACTEPGELEVLFFFVVSTCSAREPESQWWSASHLAATTDFEWHGIWGCLLLWFSFKLKIL